ncbi:MAG TPA: AAA family ATPase, partial [Anaerolineales bacterium]|nr:AAA family ATPase [Anaerolineales bacterium]
MHRLVPELIIENYRLGRDTGEFPAVGIFLDLSGFSTMTDTLMQHGQHGAEVLAGLMHGVFDPLIESIFAYGGKIISFAGDGIMALFPIEADARPTALIALAAAAEIQMRLGENPGRQTIYGKFHFSVKIGLAIGNVAWGILRSEDNENATYYFRGIPVDESAEAEHHASAGETIITRAMKALLEEEIETRPIGSFHRFEGFSVKMPIATPAVFGPVDLETARVFMPEKIIVQDLRGEFRQIVNLFMRFPDLPNEVLIEFFHTVFEIQKKYGGLLNRLDFGDKGCNLLMLWGAPVAYENDITRALNFILDLRSRVDFPITTGLTYYIAHAGYLGSAMCEDYTCYGWGVNLASRFMMSAPPGQIWVDDRIARRLSTRFDIEYIGTQRFKGFSTEQTVNLLKGHKREPELIYQGELIGREQEIRQLENFAGPLWAGKFAGFLLVMGDAGIGKGRLVHEFQSSALFDQQTALWAVCQSDQILRQSFNPIRGWLRRYFGLASASNASERKQLFNTKLDELIAATRNIVLANELDRLRSALGALVDLHWTESRYEQLDAEGRYNSTLLALIALIKAESLSQPLILFIEDMQFIDEDTLNFLPRLKRAILAESETYPIAVVATSRKHINSPALSSVMDAYIDLTGLSLEGVARLTEILLGGVPAVELIKLVMERSEGNPYFAEQIIRYLQEENFIEMSPVGWNKVKQTRDFFVPGDIRAVLVARLDQLPHEVKDVVHTASVLGREFTLSALIEMSTDPVDIRRIVADAQQSEIWVPRSEGHYLFTHGLLRDAAYTMQMRARRQELHRLAMNALEKIYANELKFHYAELAYHAKYAELGSMAQKYYTLAGKSAAESY